jgi:hypothetical protein
MDIQQLQLLAGRTRDLLQQSNQALGHNQSLDLIAALPGLRNWPEVRAFPDRVAACKLDESSASRLAFRLQKKYGLNLSASELLASLSETGPYERTQLPEVWPSGPEPGVYVTTSEKAIAALLERYEDATDGAVVYAEEAGNDWDGSIDLGESGLWSRGLNRVPSGTLLVVGPLHLNQQDWQNSAERLEMACLRAQNSGHRVAALIKSPAPESICADLHLMVRSVQTAGDDCETALLGLVTEDGHLDRTATFARPRTQATRITTAATVDAIPPTALPLLKTRLAARRTGLLLFGSSIIEEHRAADLVAASLALTEEAGPAARIMPRSRRTPEKDWQVPEPIKQLPFLPSIQSAYEQGYRRIIFHPVYTKYRLIEEYADKTLLIAGAYGGTAEEIFVDLLRWVGFHNRSAVLTWTVAILGCISIQSSRGTISVSDLFVPGNDERMPASALEEALQYITDHRLLRWQEQLGPLLKSGNVKVEDVRRAIGRDQEISEFLSEHEATLNQLRDR